VVNRLLVEPIDPRQAGKSSTASRTSRRRADSVTVDPQLCKACGLCIAFCPTTVFDADATGKPIVARFGDCNACRFCEQHCPDFAIEVTPAARPDDKAGQDGGGEA
jgi:2-oxoglutarate ferredoxin oxidoreductase subunit delta